MAIKTTIKITKGKLSYTLWTIDGIAYGPTNPSVPESGLIQPADYLDVIVNDGTPLRPDRLELTMQGRNEIVCLWASPKPGAFSWSLNGRSITSGVQNVAVVLPPELFADLEKVSGDRVEPAPGQLRESRLEIFHTWVP